MAGVAGSTRGLKAACRLWPRLWALQPPHWRETVNAGLVWQCEATHVSEGTRSQAPGVGALGVKALGVKAWQPNQAAAN